MTVSVDAVVYYRVSNATVSIANVENAHHSTRLLAQTTLRNTMGTRHLHEILSERVSISGSMQVSKPYLWVHLILPPLLPLQAESTTNPYPTHFTLIPKLSSILVHNVYVRLSSKTYVDVVIQLLHTCLLISRLAPTLHPQNHQNSLLHL